MKEDLTDIVIVLDRSGSMAMSNWEFVFLAMNIDVASCSDRLGIARGNAMKYTSDGAGTKAALHDLNVGTTAYRGGPRGQTRSDNFWKK